MRIFPFAIISLFALVMSGCLDKNETPSTQEQLAMDLETIDAYIAANGLNAMKDKNGVRYVINELGTKGVPPRIDQVINATYTGTFIDGSTFDSGTAEGPLGGFIPGWRYALSAWPVGTKAKLFVPSPLGYGPNPDNSRIPKNAILIFDVTLNQIVLTNAEKQRFTADTTAIEKFLADRTIDAETDTTGVRIVITEPGSGAHPGLYSKVKFNYTGTALGASTQFFSGSSAPDADFDSRVVDFINGLKIGLMRLGVDGKCTVYVPSGLAFGPNEITSSGVAANANVIYDIELLEIVP